MPTNVPQSGEVAASSTKPEQEATPITQPVIEATEVPEYRSARASVDHNPTAEGDARLYSLDQDLWVKRPVGVNLVPFMASVAGWRSDGNRGWEYQLVDTEKHPIRIGNTTWFPEAQLERWQT